MVDNSQCHLVMKNVVAIADYCLDPHGVVTSRPGAGGPLWEGSRGFSKERWAFWKSRFGVLETWDQLPDKTRNDAKMARTIMERTETLV